MPDLIVFQKELKKLRDGSVFRALVLQLEKDLFMSGMNGEELRSGTPEELIFSLRTIMVNALKHDAELLRSFLYRVDVDEKLVVELITRTDDAPENLVKTVLFRILEKVEYKQKNSGT